MIGLLAERGNYSVDALIGSSQHLFGRIELPGLLPVKPYDLPSVRNGACAVVGSGFLASRSPKADVAAVVSRLKVSFDEVVFWDHADPFQLDLAADDLRHFSRIMKVNGIYRDGDLYNFHVGSPSPLGCWTEKTSRRPGAAYEPGLIGSIQLGPPCFLSTVPRIRSRTRRLYQPWPERVGKDQVDRVTESLLSLRRYSQPRVTAHLAGSLTHVQRRTALRLVRKAGVDVWGGITGVPPFIAGFADRFGMARLDDPSRLALELELRSEDLMIPPLARPSYLASMSACKAVVSITGYGELCFRMAEAWAAGRVLVCQDLSHVRINYPIQPGRNVIYCRSDLTDLASILDDIECNWPRYRHIGEQGRVDWLTWARTAPEIIEGMLRALRG